MGAIHIVQGTAIRKEQQEWNSLLETPTEILKNPA